MPRFLQIVLHVPMQDVLPSNVADALMTRKMDPQLRRVMTHSTSNNSTGYGRDRDAERMSGSGIAAHHTGGELAIHGAAAASPSHFPAESPLSLTGLVGTLGPGAAASPHGSSPAGSQQPGDSTASHQAVLGVGAAATAVVAVPLGLPPLHSHSSVAAAATASGSAFGHEAAQLQQQQYPATPTSTPRVGSLGGLGLLPAPAGSHGGSGVLGPSGGFNGAAHVSVHGAAGGGPDSPAPRLGSTISGSGGAFLGTFGSTGDIVYK